MYRLTCWRFVSFGLPPTFPPEAMPDAGAQFVKACWAGITKGQLLTRARKLAWRPIWERQAHMVAEEGIEVYGFALVIDGCVVPLMARMRRVPEPRNRRGRLNATSDNRRFSERDFHEDTE